MILRNLVIAALAGGVAAAAIAAPAATRNFPVAGFDRVSASGSEDISIVTGKAASVTARGDESRLDRLDIRVEGTTLKIGHKPGNWNSWGGDKTQITITMPALHAVSASGSGNITADSGTGPAFTAHLSGSGDLSLARVDSPSVALSTSGSGDIAAAGKCSTAKVTISGSGDMSLANLACQDIEIKISGSGDVSARATGNANVRISGSGDVNIAGGARCTSRTSGSGNVACS
jgi:hypothetical protein